MTIGNTVTGILHGRTIELDQTVAIADGQRVEVVIRSVSAKPGDGIRASAGAWADAGNDLDRWLEATMEARSSNRDLT
ncbi:MAG: hypothetical protein K8U03_04475 [Planctomycetia bacterium]|nr:hypothetical protein [Planctomycetia bacterium]